MADVLDSLRLYKIFISLTFENTTLRRYTSVNDFDTKFVQERLLDIDAHVKQA